MQEGTRQAKLDPPHRRRAIPPVALPQIMKPAFRRGLLLDLCRLVIDAAGDRRGMLAEVQRCNLLPAQAHDIRPIDRSLSRTPVLSDCTRDEPVLPVGSSYVPPDTIGAQVYP